MSPELEKLWRDYKRIAGTAWICDCNPNVSDKKLFDAWERERVAGKALEQAIEALEAAVKQTI